MPLTTSSKRGAFEAEKPIRCEHCGAMRPPRKVVREDGTPVEFNGIPAFWGHEDCGCPGAVAEREAIAEAERRKAAKEQAEAKERAIERAAGCDVLILDDLGKEASNTAYACERLFAIIDKRDKAMLPTIVTSNYRLSEIAKNITEGAVGVAIASRLASSCKQVPLEGPDRRLNGQD